MQPLTIEIGEFYQMTFANRAGTFQHGTVTLYREGRRQAVGHIGMFCGTTLKDIWHVWKVKTQFEVGTAGKAFVGVPYLEGVSSRNSIKLIVAVDTV